MAAANVNIRFTKTNGLTIFTIFVAFDPFGSLNLDILTLFFVRAGVGNFQNIRQLDNTEKVGFNPNIGLEL
jgi:hypothetical protein